VLLPRRARAPFLGPLSPSVARGSTARRPSSTPRRANGPRGGGGRVVARHCLSSWLENTGPGGRFNRVCKPGEPAKAPRISLCIGRGLLTERALGSRGACAEDRSARLHAPPSISSRCSARATHTPRTPRASVGPPRSDRITEPSRGMSGVVPFATSPSWGSGAL
jgi:hypothetical protein